ncbi:Secretory peptide [Caenorhabditis elegans]|uniref:Secretory peptide n=1 Tax=Caenorhabditis elegans TaxID=6239 RepID=B1Q264_CAEEL|nr:Secretory peptide [Caenorhabditis elegans]CAQ16158.1 Secretory peptide [Caenorhabditis elegans]|eukprot:NP_001123030.1 Uncharacterized protein CELE_W07G4.7 [Caenorhabditis elegans]
MKFVLLLVSLFGIAKCRLMCGIDPILTNWMEISIKLDCPAILEQHRTCCLAHGWCYVYKKATMEACNNEYCRCVSVLANEGVCKTHSDNFCMNVRNMGPMLWPTINENGMAF